MAGANPVPLNIVIILPGLGAGGTERVVNFLGNRWVQKGWRVTVLTLGQAGEHSFYNYDPQVRICRLALPPRRRGVLAGLWWAARRARLFRQHIKQIRPDLVISFLSRTNVLALVACLGLATPVIVSERNNPVRQSIGPVWTMLRSLLYRRAFGLVTMTQGARDHFPQSQRPRSWIIPNFADSRKTVPAGTASAGRCTIVAVGRLVDQKGFDLLIAAFAQIADRVPNWKLVIWGEGENRPALERQRDQLGLESRIALPGVSPDYAGWLNGADAFVMSSRYEGWGIALLEAMAAGLAVISFDCDFGPAEMIQDGIDGLIVQREDVAGLAAAMATVMADPALRRRLGDAARQSATRFNAEAAGAAWDQVAIEATGRKSAPALAAALMTLAYLATPFGDQLTLYIPSVMNTL